MDKKTMIKDVFFIYLTLNTSDNIKIVKTKIQSKKKLDKNTGQKSQKNEKKKKNKVAKKLRNSH
jgi:hypothetical protein